MLAEFDGKSSGVKIVEVQPDALEDSNGLELEGISLTSFSLSMQL